MRFTYPILKANSFCIAIIIHCTFNATESSAQSILPSDSKIQYIGRIDTSKPNSPTYKYPGISIKAQFSGTGISAVIDDEGNGTDEGANFYKVLIDDAIYTEQVKMLSGENTYTIATGLTMGTHTIEFIKITEGASGLSSFKGFTIIGGSQTLLDLPFPKGKKIEFIGDSWTCGFGNLSQFSTGNLSMTNANYIAKNEDNYYAWGPRTARSLDADYHVTASSGRGLYRNNTGALNNTIPLNYDFVLEDDHSAVYKHGFHPDVIVIHLGTNDMAQEESGQQFKLDDGIFEKTYLDFISKLLTLHPCANVIICFGNSKSDAWPTWTKQLSRLRTIADNIINIHNKGNVTKLELPYTAEKWTGNSADDCGYGDAWHPSLCSHEEMSVKLVEKITAMNLNWGNQSNCPTLADTSLWENTHLSTNLIPKLSLNVGPNPFGSTISINYTEKIDEWKLIDVRGQTILVGTERNINTSLLRPGMYHLGITINNELVWRKIIKK